MCGIIGFTGHQNASQIILQGLKTLEYRGYDSAGMAIQNEAGLRTVKASGQIKNLCEKTHDGLDLPGFAGIGHTRWATHGAPTDVNAHPHVSANGKFAIIHNGIVENFAMLRDELTAKGFEFKSETDTEVIAHLLESYYTGDFKQAVMKATARLEGAYALGVICSDFPGVLYAVKEASPLIIGLGAGENFFASDVTALVNHTKNVIYLEDGEFAELTNEKVTVFDGAGREVNKEISRVTWDISVAEKGGYEHFMLKEIMEQPRALKATIEPRIKDGKIVLDNFDLTYDELKDINKIIITACGSAYYAGCAGRYAIEELCRIPVEVDLASELRYRNPLVDEHTLLIVLSQSGETADTIAALKECKRRGARTLAIVNVVGSTISTLADHVLYTWAGPEIAVATTKAYVTQVALLDLFAVWAADKLGKVTAERFGELINSLLNLPSLAQRAIDLSSNIDELAAKYHKNRSMFFIGRNLDYAVCMEGSLKLKEISYVHSEAYAAGELKHGPIALLEEGSLVVAVCSYENLFDKMISNIKETKARGAEVLAFAIEGDRRILTEADDVVFVPRSEPLFLPVTTVIPSQLFAYYVAREKGCDIDKPKNLAKSVTVE